MKRNVKELETLVASGEFAGLTATTRADALNELAWEIKFADARRALELSERARRLSSEAHYARGLACGLRNCGACNYLLANYHAGLGESLESLRLFEEMGDDAGRADALNIAGNVQERLGNHRDALELHLRALEIRERASDREGASTSLNNLGNVYTSFGEYATALNYYLRSLSLYESIESKTGVGRALNNIGIVYHRLGENDKALESFMRAFQLKMETGDKQNEAHVLFNIGCVYETEGDTNSALEYYFRSLQRSREFGDRQAEAVCLSHIGNVFKTSGDQDNAGRFYSDALKITVEAGIRYFEAEVRILLGETRTLTGETGVALEHLTLALSTAEELDSSELVYRAHRALSEACEVAGDVGRALTHHKKFHSTREHVFGEDAAKRIKHVVIRSEIEKAEREAEIYRLRNIELAQAAEELRRANEQKGKLVAQLEEQREALERETREDFLTRLSNRRHADALLAQEFSRARRFQRDFTIAMLDIDNFKMVNDRFSHHTGDEVIRGVARILKETCREIDLVARYGGEEFVLGLIETSVSKAAILCEKLREKIEAHDWQQLAPGLRVTVSFGLAGDLGLPDLPALLSAADAKLYEAKRGGRNQVRL